MHENNSILQVIVTEILKAPKITEIDLTFDQNMRPCVAFVSDSIPKLY